MKTKSSMSIDAMVERHLRLALAADDPDEKNYHIRNALQAELIRS